VLKHFRSRKVDPSSDLEPHCSPAEIPRKRPQSLELFTLQRCPVQSADSPSSGIMHVNAYVCTYRHFQPSRAQRRKTEEAAKDDPLLRDFLIQYDQSYFDWGDDPSFYSAFHRLGTINKASWGVCRQDVRTSLVDGDVVVFFCAKQDKPKKCWHYFFIGFGTVKHVVERRDLWTKAAYKPYRSFYNVLACFDGTKLVQREYFHPYHDDWQTRRAVAPYIIFDPTQSAFDVISPHHVAKWDSGTPPPEVWNGDLRSKKLERLLFGERQIKRRLRTSSTGYAHTKLNLTKDGAIVRKVREIHDLRAALRHLV